MELEWDEVKNQRNIRKHGISFETAALVFTDPLHVSIQDRVENGEQRWQTLGVVQGHTVLFRNLNPAALKHTPQNTTASPNAPAPAPKTPASPPT